MPCVPQGNAAVRQQRRENIIGTIVIVLILAIVAWALWSTHQGVNTKRDTEAKTLAGQLRQLLPEQQPAVINQSEEPALVAKQLGDGYVVKNSTTCVTSASVAENKVFFKTIWVTQITKDGKETHRYELVQ